MGRGICIRRPECGSDGREAVTGEVTNEDECKRRVDGEPVLNETKS